MENCKEINDWEVLTSEGWQDFDGIKKVKKENYLNISYILPNGQKETIQCSKGHQLLVKRFNEIDFCFAEMISCETDELVYKTGEEFCKIISILEVREPKELYDLVNVKNGYKYIANSVVNHNCAHVEGIDDLWLGLRPTLSTGGNAILISSPSGVGTLFHRLWMGAHKDQNEKGEGGNDFYPIELPWTVHPERDEKWFEREKKSLLEAKGERGLGMELLCSFASSGDTFIKGDVMEKLMIGIKEPIEKVGIPYSSHGRDEMWIWKHPDPEHKYVIGADVARGDAQDYSAFNVINIDTDEVVADFRGKCSPDKFAALLLEVGEQYNNALVCQELNNVGVVTAIKLKESGYENLYYEKFMKNMYMSYVTQDVGDELPGFTTTQNSRVEILAKLSNNVRNKKIKLYSKRLFEELQTFIWKKDKPQAQKGYNDDLIMSLAVASNLYESAGKSISTDANEMAMAMLAGMSRNERSMDTNTGKTKQITHTADGFWSLPGKRSEQIAEKQQQKFKQQNQRLSPKGKNIHNYNSSEWDFYRWVFDD